MAAQLFNRIGQLGLGLAVAGSVANTLLLSFRQFNQLPVQSEK